MLKEDNTLSVEEIQAKLKDKGINVSVSVVKRAFKNRKYKYRNKKLMLRQCFWIQIKREQESVFEKKYIDLYYSKIIFTNEWVFKGGNIETESGEPRMNLIKYQH